MFAQAGLFVAPFGVLVAQVRLGPLNRSHFDACRSCRSSRLSQTSQAGRASQAFGFYHFAQCDRSCRTVRPFRDRHLDHVCQTCPAYHACHGGQTCRLCGFLHLCCACRVHLFAHSNASGLDSVSCYDACSRQNWMEEEAVNGEEQMAAVPIR